MFKDDVCTCKQQRVTPGAVPERATPGAVPQRATRGAEPERATPRKAVSNTDQLHGSRSDSVLKTTRKRITLVMMTWIQLATKQFMFPKLMIKHYAKRVCEDANHTGWACQNSTRLATIPLARRSVSGSAPKSPRGSCRAQVRAAG